MLRSSSRALVALVAAIAVAPARAAGQSAAQPTPRDTAGPVCLGFSFGAWSPALDWRAAGHGRMPDPSVAAAPTGRDWAMDGIDGIEDSIMLLFPRWWPVGVAVTLPTRRPAPGDTVEGRAQALVADARTRPPVSRVRAWAVPCGGGRPPR